MQNGGVKTCREVSVTKFETTGTLYVALFTGDKWRRKYCSLDITVEVDRVLSQPNSPL